MTKDRKDNLTPFPKGQSGNNNGRPKGTYSKKKKLLNLLKDLSQLTDKIGDREKMLVYQLYEIVEGDINIGLSISSSVDHLYFMESEFGIKIGISKHPNKRLAQIKMYAPSTNILKVIQFAGKFEKDIHKKFEYLNIKNTPNLGIEWFVKSDDLLAFIDEIETLNDFHKYFNPKGNGQLKMF
jgi:hypothetical protein